MLVVGLDLVWEHRRVCLPTETLWRQRVKDTPRRHLAGNGFRSHQYGLTPATIIRTSAFEPCLASII